MFSIKPRKHDDVTEKYGKFLYYSFPRPSILEGLARIFDLGGTLRSSYYPTRPPYEIDIAAMRSDWIEIGRDIDLAIGAYTDGGNSEHCPMSDFEKAHLPDRPSTQRRDDLTTEAPQTTAASASWLGPLPPPSVLRSFDEVLPGSAERVLVLAEKQSDHRMLMENTITRGGLLQELPRSCCRVCSLRHGHPGWILPHLPRARFGRKRFDWSESGRSGCRVRIRFKQLSPPTS